MSKRHFPKLPPILLDELAGTGWRIVAGGKHWKIMIGQDLVAIWPRGKLADVDRRNTLSCRRNVRHWKDAHHDC